MKILFEITAKHTWTKLTEIEKIGQNIEIKIEIEEIKQKDFLICRVWSTIGDLREEGVPDFEILRKDATTKDFLHRILNSYFNTKMVGSKGAMKKEHLGISEMKISAGYLSNQSLKTIGGYSKNRILMGNYGNESKGFIKATSIWEPHGLDLIPKLGYKFKMNKPKDLVIISNKKEDGDLESRENGIYVLSPEEIIEQEINLDYGFCVLKASTFKINDKESIFYLVKKILNGKIG